MTHPSPIALLLLASFAVGGCASVPEVESRLKTLQFHPNMYVVKAGDTLESIAWRYRLTPERIASLNPDVAGRLEPGLRINVRPGTELPQTVRTRAGWRGPEGGASVSAAARPEVTWPAEGAGVATGSVAVPSTTSVVVSPVATRSAPAPRAGSRLDDDVLLARGDTGGFDVTDDRAWSAPAAGGSVEEAFWPREEIVPDDLDIAAADPRAALDEELQRYVGRWTWPTDGALARRFAPELPNGQGIDIAGVPGQDVRAALDGKVVYSGRDLNDEGNLVIVRHDDALMTTYSHADRLFVAEDDEVLAGDPIASLGWNDERESVLRFEVRRDGEPLDPMVFLPPSP